MDNPFKIYDLKKVSLSDNTLNKKIRIKLFNKTLKNKDLFLKLPQLNNNNILRLRNDKNLKDNSNNNFDSSSFSSLSNEKIYNSISEYQQKTSRNYNNIFSIKKNNVLDNDYSFNKNKLLFPKRNLTLTNNLNNSSINKNKNRTIINIYNTSVKNSSKFILLSSNNITTLNTLKTNTLVTTNNSLKHSIKHNNTFNNNENSSLSSISNEPKLFKKSLTKKKIKKKLKNKKKKTFK